MQHSSPAPAGDLPSGVDGRGVARWLPWGWSALLALLMLGPALAPGYVLTYDMVWVPDLALRLDALGVGSGLPRAVPSDALVAVLDELVPGMVLQKLVLVAVLTGAGAGAARLVGRLPSRAAAGLPAQCLAASVFVWNPFVVERLVIGHWPVLAGYAALPWLVLAARDHRASCRPGALLFLLPLASLSASAGVASAVAVLAAGCVRGRRRPNLVLAGLVVAANAPWLVSGLLHATDATSDPAGARAFALRGEGPLPGPLTALGLGGIWNSEVVPTTREGFLGVASLLLLLALAALGARPWWRAVPRRDAVSLVALWGIGYGVAAVSWATPDSIAWLASAMPGGGLLRDGSRLLGLCAPLLVCLVAQGAARVGSLLHHPLERRVIGAMLVLLPLSLMPDAVWGVTGRLSAVRYPASYDATRAVIGDGDGADVAILPFTSYRQPTWNDDRKVLDPLGRFLAADTVVSDDLVVSGVTVVGEDPRARAVRSALDQGDPEARRDALLRLGIGWVVTDAATDRPAALPGEVPISAVPMPVVRLGEAHPQPVRTSWWVAMGAAWAAFLTPWAALLASRVGVRRRRNTQT